MEAKRILIFVLVFLVAIGLGALIAIYLGQEFVLVKEKPYYAVQMENGDLYFGKINRFPKLVLKDVYIVQSVQDLTNPLGSSLRVTSLTEATIWRANEIELNSNKVISVSKVDDGSQVMQAIKGQK